MMSDALAQRRDLVLPTGEIVDLTGVKTDALACWLDEIRQTEHDLREKKQIVAAEVLDRMDHAAAWTLHAGDYTLTGRSPEPEVEYDGAQLIVVLDDLLADGLITREARDAACETLVTYKPRKRGLNALLKRGGVVRERVEACATAVPPQRRVSVKLRNDA